MSPWKQGQAVAGALCGRTGREQLHDMDRDDFGTNPGMRMPSRREFLGLLSAGLVVPGLLTGCSGKGRRPNIIVIMVDDLGYADLSAHLSLDAQTPHIDSLARNGVECTQAYVPLPVCGPCRAGLLTGRYPQRFGFHYNPPLKRRGPRLGLPLSERTLAEVLKENGYATGLVGKWHLGLHQQFHPMQRGFQEFFGFLDSKHSCVKSEVDEEDPICRGFTPLAEKEYLTDAFSREAAAFIERHKDEPFFLYLSYNACHVPLEPPPAKYLDRFADIADEKRRTYCAMLSAVDDGVGRVMETLRRLGLEENTLLVFLSDNGGPNATTACNAPFRAGKGSLYEGGIHVPMILQWKKHLPAGKQYDQPVTALDVFPTALAAAKVRIPRELSLDGDDLMPFLTGKASGIPHEVLYWQYGPEQAIRRGNWKYLKHRMGETYLFDLSADPGESVDRSNQRPELAKELAEELDRWAKQLAEPLWPPSRLARRHFTEDGDGE